jgi:hypothetical protein
MSQLSRRNALAAAAALTALGKTSRAVIQR